MYHFIIQYLKENNITDSTKFSLQDDGEGAYIKRWDYNIPAPDVSNLTYVNIVNKKLEIISTIKLEAYRRITEAYPEYKQRNLNGAVSEIQNKEVIALKAGAGNYTPTEAEMTSLRAAKACKEFVDGLRAKSNELESSLDEMTEEQLNAFNPSEDSHWE